MGECSIKFNYKQIHACNSVIPIGDYPETWQLIIFMQWKVLPSWSFNNLLLISSSFWMFMIVCINSISTTWSLLIKIYLNNNLVNLDIKQALFENVCFCDSFYSLSEIPTSSCVYLVLIPYIYRSTQHSQTDMQSLLIKYYLNEQNDWCFALSIQ